MSPEQNIRIIVVTPNREQARALVASLELMERNFQVTNVASGEEARLEFDLGSQYDLLITDNHLGGMSGVELIKAARRRQADIKALMLADDPSKASEALDGVELEAILGKPLDAGDISDAVHTALFGPLEDPEPQLDGRAGGTSPLVVSSKAVESEFGPIPPVDIGAIQALLEPQLLPMGAMAIAFVNRAGDALLELGSFPSDLRFSELLIFIARNLNNSATIATYIGPVPSTTMHYYDGKKYDIFAISVGVHFFVTLVFPGNSQSELGSVMRFRRNVIWTVIDVIGVDAAMGQAAEAIREQRQELATGPLPALDLDETEDSALADAEPMGALAEARARAAAAREAEKGPRPDLEIDVFEFEEEEDVEMLDIDLGELGEPDTLEISDEDFGEMDDFWDVEDDIDILGEDSISMDEALEMGFFDDE